MLSSLLSKGKGRVAGSERQGLGGYLMVKGLIQSNENL